MAQTSLPGAIRSPPMRLTNNSSLLSAALGVARTAVYNDNDMVVQRAVLSDLSLQIPPLKPFLQEMMERLTTEDPHEEIGQLRRAKLLMRPMLRADILELGVELVAMVTQPAVNALRCTADLYVPEGEGQKGLRIRVVLLAARSVRENAERVERFFEQVEEFVRGRKVGIHPMPVFTVAMLGEGGGQFDRLRDRLAIRLSGLSTGGLGYAESFVGNLETEFSYNCNRDPCFVKRVVSAEASEFVVGKVVNGVLSRAFAQNVGEVLKGCVDSGVGTVRILMLSMSSWCEGGEAVRQWSDGIRGFVVGGVRCLEMRLDLFADWDYAMVKQVLLYGVSAGVLVFRFDSLEGLARYVGKSKAVTDRFPGLTASAERIVYVDMISTQGFEEVVEAVQEIAVERRMLEPMREDVLFEADGPVLGVLCERARYLPSILNSDLDCSAKPYLQRVVRVLNREISEEEMMEESLECMQFILRLKSAIHTKVSIKKNPNCVTVCRGDATGYSLQGTNLSKLLRVGDYRNFRDVTTTQPVTVEAKMLLGKEVGAVLHDVRMFSRKWQVVMRLADMVREGKLVLTVADERKVTLERGGLSYVTAMYCTVLGGGQREFLHAMMIRSCVEAVRADPENVAVRALLRLVPGFAAAAYNLREVVPWDQRRNTY